ncbi:MAG: bifunctional 4-hydroxy-2-oxoglutarate aldolase/2-dehydro-3-deoxy-phosphogluconate aldolase [Clostridia bacterium]|nr:bifunctional 4-hydroxy-2-oxoglutarate aldolase/2-dehydro-3-deoxy-phosphogluconate aldolase [Clostridia bacterium]
MNRYDRYTFEKKLIAILRGYSFNDALFAINTAVKGGIDVFEIAIRHGYETQDLITLSALKKTLPESVILGAGTVLGVELMEKAIRAGADFIVSPVVEPAVITKCKGYGVPCIPGASTPTEIYNAYSLGATLVKFFPAGDMGSTYLRAIKSPLSQVPIVAMGGITSNNIAEFSDAGATSFGISTGIFRPEEIASRNETAILNRIKAYRF